MKDGCDHIVFVDNNKIPHTGDNESLYRCGYTFFPPVEVLLKCRGSAAEVPLKCHWSSIEMQTATATDFPLLTPPLSTIGWSKTVSLNNLGEKRIIFFLLIHHRPILGIHSLTRGLQDKTSGSGCFAMAQTEKHTNRQRWPLYDWVGPEGWFSETHLAIRVKTQNI